MFQQCVFDYSDLRTFRNADLRHFISLEWLKSFWNMCIPNHDFSGFSTQTFSHFWLLSPNLMRHTSSVQLDASWIRLKILLNIVSGYGTRYKTTRSISFFKFTLNFTWKRIFNLSPWGIALHRIRVCHQFWA